MSSQYLNTDLILQSKQDLSVVRDRLATDCDLLYAEIQPNGAWHLTVEAKGSGELDDPQATAERDTTALLAALEGLVRDALLKPDECEIEFNIGWASAIQRPEGRMTLSPSTLQRMAALDATLAVTVYPSSENDLG